jgi:hypothetical protein
MTGRLDTVASGNIGAAGPVNSLLVAGATSDWAAMTFYSPGSFGGNFGMHPTTGDFYCGGWSFGAGQAFVFWTQRNLNPIKDGRLANAGDFAFPAAGNNYTTGIYEPRAGAVVTGLLVIGGDAGVTGSRAGLCNGGRWRFLQLLTPGGWYTVGYV